MKNFYLKKIIAAPYVPQTAVNQKIKSKASERGRDSDNGASCKGKSSGDDSENVHAEWWYRM